MDNKIIYLEYGGYCNNIYIIQIFFNYSVLDTFQIYILTFDNYIYQLCLLHELYRD